MKSRMAVFSLLLMIMGALFLFGCSQNEAGQPDNGEGSAPVTDYEVVVGSKEFTEPLILGQITILALEYHGIPTVDETGLAGTEVARGALESGDIDLYWEYTGTGMLVILGHEETPPDPDETYNAVKEEDMQNGMVWLDYTPFNNTYTIMMRRADSEMLGITTISELAAAINEGTEAPEPGVWSFASGHEYSARSDSYEGLVETYGFEFESLEIMDLALTYDALQNEEVATASGFATDPRITAYDLVNLEDDRDYHAIYNCAPVVRQEVMNELPQIADILNPIAKALDAETMSGLNMKVDMEDYLPREAAEEWLLEEGFIE